MKTRTSLFGATFCTACAASACAQSSVTLYGIVDIGIRHVSNSGVGTLDSLASGGNKTSRLGLRGTEDMGGGLNAGFKLEALINADTGQAGSTTMPSMFWSRASYVEIGSRSYGTLRLGYDLNPAYLTWFENDPWLNIGMGSSGNLYDTSQNGPLRSVFGPVAKGETTTTYTRNMLQYFTPNVGGFFGVAAYAPRENAITATGAARQGLLRFGYNAGGPFAAAVSLARTDAQVLDGGPLSRLNDAGATAAYDFGPVKLAATWRQFRAATSKETHYFVAATAPVSVGRLQASYGKVRMGGTVTTNLAPGTTAGTIDANGASMWAVGYVHYLSKRTSLYTTAVRISNRGKSFLSLPGGPAATSATFAGRASTGFDVGISHTF